MRRVLGWIAAVVVVIGCQSSPTAANRPNVFLIVVDTLRADRLGAYGNQRGLTPFLDAWAADGQVVREVRVQAPWTNPSVASLFTSRYLSQHGIVEFASVLADSETTLAEVLKGAGYVTGGFSANGLIGARSGFGQGFDHYEARPSATDAARTLLKVPDRADVMAAAALAWLDTVRDEGADAAPVFLYLHLMEPHLPYAPPPELLARLRPGRPPLDLRVVNEAMFLSNAKPVGPERLEEILDAYDASVMAVDAALRDFVAGLERRSLLRHAIIVVTADHGEEFLEHGVGGHGKSLFDEALRVPLLMHVPGATPSGTVDRLVASVDVAPTILELAGVPTPERFEGTSFAGDLPRSGWRAWLDRLRARVVDRRPAPAVYSERLPQTLEARGTEIFHARALVFGQEKVIELRDGQRRFYALDLDPGEQSPNLVDERDRAQLEGLLAEARSRAERDRTVAESRPPDKRTRDALRALGYAE